MQSSKLSRPSAIHRSGRALRPWPSRPRRHEWHVSVFHLGRSRKATRGRARTPKAFANQNRLPWVLHDRTASCLEGGIFGAAALRIIGFPPFIFDLEAEQDSDHVVAIFKVRGHWGAVAKSNFTGCRYREPVYRSLRELAMSYFNIYFNLRGERTLRRYSRPVNLARFDHLNWMTTEKPIWFIAEYLCDIPHISLVTPAQVRQLTRVDRRNMSGEMVGHRTR